MEKESERKTHNTAYIPTKCRVTKPVPPKPATNPLQFVAVKPSPLLIKAQEITKQVEIVKEARKERKEEAEDWQSNLDNWKSSRRKRQEHIIERVEEVKKLEQLEEKERSRRRGTTFSEILEKRNKGRFSIPIYDNDSNDLSDYGIGSSSSKTNSIKDVDTDDNSSILDEKETLSDEATTPTIISSTRLDTNDNEKPILPSNNEHSYNKLTNSDKKKEVTNNGTSNHSSVVVKPANEQYTYEGAIEDYRSRIRSKIHLSNDAILQRHNDDSVKDLKSKEFSEAQTLLPKGNLCERRKMFELNMNGSSLPKHVEEELMNAQSIKERLQSLERCTEQNILVPNVKRTSTDETLIGNLKSRLNQFANANNAKCDSDAKNIFSSGKSDNGKESPEYDNHHIESNDYDVYMDKIKTSHLEEMNMNGFRPSTSSSDLVATSSDREDSGIHTADVSCSVSQSDEPVEDSDILSQETPNFRAITETFLNCEKDFADKNYLPYESKVEEPEQVELETKIVSEVEANVPLIAEEQITILESPILEETIEPQIEETVVLEPQHSPLVEHIAKTIQDVPLLEESHENDKVFDYYENTRTPFTMDSINDIFVNPLSPPKLKPPTEKPPPPPQIIDDDDSKMKPTIRIKKELLIKRSSFLGLEESAINEHLEQLEIQEKQKEQLLLQQEQQLLQLQQANALSTIRNNDEEEIMKKEREIIEMIEKEEKFKDHEPAEIRNQQEVVMESKDFPKSVCNTNSPVKQSVIMEPNDIYLGNKKFDEPFYPEPCYDNLNDQDSEVLRVEHELLQLEKEELKRQREIQLFQERSAKLNYAACNPYENVYSNDYYAKNAETRKSMPDLKNLPIVDSRQSHAFQNKPRDGLQYQKSVPNVQKSMPNIIQHNNQPYHQHNQVLDYHRNSNSKYGNVPVSAPLSHRKSMPDLDRLVNSAFTPTSANNNLLMPIKPLKPLDKKDRYICQNPIESDAYMHPGRGMLRHSMQNPPPSVRSKSMPREPWIQPKAKPQTKSYNQHWLYQEAELRRLADQQKAAALQNRQNHHHVIDKNVMDPNRILSDKIPKRSIDPVSQKDYVNIPYMGRQQQTYGHALPMSYPQPMATEEGQDVILSVSGKKKCSYCNNELGRGAAMIIESLSLFYHMECFKCCVCHMELGDGMMGTDVRVRNQKLHCHNCYSSDDGIKFSCV